MLLKIRITSLSSCYFFPKLILSANLITLFVWIKLIWVNRLLFPPVLKKTKKKSPTLQSKTTLFFFCPIKCRLGSFSALWMTLTVSCWLLSASHFPTRGDLHQSTYLTEWVGGVCAHVKCLKGGEKKKGTNGLIRQKQWIEETQIQGNERQSEMKGAFFLWHFSWWAVRRWSVLPQPLFASRSRASNSCRQSTFIVSHNYTRGLSVLWVLSGGANPSAASQPVLLLSPFSTNSKKDMMVYTVRGQLYSLFPSKNTVIIQSEIAFQMQKCSWNKKYLSN